MDILYFRIFSLLFVQRFVEKIKRTVRGLEYIYLTLLQKLLFDACSISVSSCLGETEASFYQLIYIMYTGTYNYIFIRIVSILFIFWKNNIFIYLFIFFA